MKHHSLVTRYSYPSGLIGASHHIMGGGNFFTFCHFLGWQWDTCYWLEGRYFQLRKVTLHHYLSCQVVVIQTSMHHDLSCQVVEIQTSMFK